MSLISAGSISLDSAFKGTLRHVFIRVYRLEIQSVVLVFSAQRPSLWFNSTPSPSPSSCVREGVQQINTCLEVPLQVNFLDAFYSMSLIFQRVSVGKGEAKIFIENL
jgi:hypothetical protein